MRTLLACHALLLSGVAALVCCTETDPYARPGQWHPLGANDLNLRAMVADPTDLEYGRSTTQSPGDLAAAAVARLRLDAVKPLPASGVADVKVNDSGDQPQGAGAGAGGANPAAAAPAAAPAAATSGF